MSARVCLSMIVRDEAHVIGRCLQAMKPPIDTWVIVVDTGSTDGTQALIRSLPGRCAQRTARAPLAQLRA